MFSLEVGMYDTVIFDYGDTLYEMGSLVDSLEAVYDSEYAYQIGKSIEQDIQNLYTQNNTLQPDWLTVWESAFNKYSQKFDVDLGLKHLNHFINSGRLYSYSLPLLESLRNQNVKLALLSNMTGETSVFQRSLENHGLSKYFDSIVWSPQVGYRKPSKVAFQYTLDSLNSSASTALMVGDSEVADIQGANAFGISSMLVSDNISNNSEANYIVDRNSIRSEILRLTET